MAAKQKARGGAVALINALRAITLSLGDYKLDPCKSETLKPIKKIYLA